jgi:hypothetical protein
MLWCVLGLLPGLDRIAKAELYGRCSAVVSFQCSLRVLGRQAHLVDPSYHFDATNLEGCNALPRLSDASSDGEYGFTENGVLGSARYGNTRMQSIFASRCITMSLPNIETSHIGSDLSRHHNIVFSRIGALATRRWPHHAGVCSLPRLRAYSYTK